MARECVYRSLHFTAVHVISNDCEYILDIAIRAIHSYVFCAVVSLISSPCSVIRKSFLFLGFDAGMREALLRVSLLNTTPRVANSDTSTVASRNDLYSRALLGRLRIQDSSELTDHKACDNKLSIRACVSRWDFGSATAGAMAGRTVLSLDRPEFPE